MTKSAPTSRRIRNRDAAKEVADGARDTGELRDGGLFLACTRSGLTNAKGERQGVKWKAEPVGGFVGLSDKDAEAKGVDLYANELNEQFAKGPVSYNPFAVLGQPGDNDDDPTAEWPADRKSVKVGTISISTGDSLPPAMLGIFDPNVVADGIEPSSTDKILPMRSQDCAVSFGRRSEYIKDLR